MILKKKKVFAICPFYNIFLLNHNLNILRDFGYLAKAANMTDEGVCSLIQTSVGNSWSVFMVAFAAREAWICTAKAPDQAAQENTLLSAAFTIIKIAHKINISLTLHSIICLPMAPFTLLFIFFSQKKTFWLSQRDCMEQRIRRYCGQEQSVLWVSEFAL